MVRRRMRMRMTMTVIHEDLGGPGLVVPWIAWWVPFQVAWPRALAATRSQSKEPTGVPAAFGSGTVVTLFSLLWDHRMLEVISHVKPECYCLFHQALRSTAPCISIGETLLLQAAGCRARCGPFSGRTADGLESESCCFFPCTLSLLPSLPRARSLQLWLCSQAL